MVFMLAYLQELCLQDAAMGFLRPSLGDAAILCNINTSGYILCNINTFGYTCKASNIAFPDNAALSDEFLVRLHVGLGPTLKMLL